MYDEIIKSLDEKIKKINENKLISYQYIDIRNFKKTNILIYMELAYSKTRYILMSSKKITNKKLRNCILSNIGYLTKYRVKHIQFKHGITRNEYHSHAHINSVSQTIYQNGP